MQNVNFNHGAAKWGIYNIAKGREDKVVESNCSIKQKSKSSKENFETKIYTYWVVSVLSECIAYMEERGTPIKAQQMDL